ncbi:MAG: TSCPD domain-containing protein [Oscillospiraceae bacterium]|nr:TSCPD domain-containing protein [Oscillospiraceae bacterium]
MKHTYYPQGTCSQVIEFEINDGVVHNVQFYGGCDGNTQGVGRLVEGMKADEVVQPSTRARPMLTFASGTCSKSPGSTVTAMPSAAWPWASRRR